MEHQYLKEAEAVYNLSLSTNIQVDKGNYLDFKLPNKILEGLKPENSVFLLQIARFENLGNPSGLLF